MPPMPRASPTLHAEKSRYRDHKDRDDKLRQNEREIGQAQAGEPHAPRAERGGKPENDAADQGRTRRNRRRQQRVPAAARETRKQIAAEMVGPQPMRDARRGMAMQQVDRVDVVLRPQRADGQHGAEARQKSKSYDATHDTGRGSSRFLPSSALAWTTIIAQATSMTKACSTA